MAQTKQSNDAIRVNSQEATLALKLFAQNKRNMMLVGAPGVGKTCLVEQAAKDLDQDVIIFHPVISDPTDMKGMPAIIPCNEAKTEYLARFIPFESLKRLLNAKKDTIAFADDLGQAAPMVQATWMQLLLTRKLDDKVVSDKITFMSASNRKEDKAGVQGILEPLKSRFVTILELVVDPDIWLEWARQPETGIHPYVRAFIRWRPKLLWDFQPTNDMTNTPSPRTVEHVSHIMRMNPPANIRPALIAGAAGTAFSQEFNAFIKVVRELPKMKMIIAQPEKVPVPQNISAQYAVVESMLDRISMKRADPFFMYISRFPKEFQGWFYQQVKQLQPDIIRTKAVVDWAVKHGVS